MSTYTEMAHKHLAICGVSLEAILKDRSVFPEGTRVVVADLSPSSGPMESGISLSLFRGEKEVLGPMQLRIYGRHADQEIHEMCLRFMVSILQRGILLDPPQHV